MHDVPIQGALVTGARDADGRQLQIPFFGAEKIDVVLSLAHEVAEIVFTTTLDVAQNLWKKATRVTCYVKIAPGKIPRVIGYPTFVCGEE